MKNAKGLARGKHIIRAFDIGNGVTIKGRVVDMKETIVTRTSPADILNGKIAEPTKCVEAQCLMRYSNENRLPFKAYAVWIYKRMAYLLLTKRPGKGGLHTIGRFMHNGWDKICEFDRTHQMTPQERVKKIAPWTITLHPPYETNKLGAYQSRSRAGKQCGSKTGTAKKRFHGGYRGRFMTLEQWKEGQVLAGLAP